MSADCRKHRLHSSRPLLPFLWNRYCQNHQGINLVPQHGKPQQQSHHSYVVPHSLRGSISRPFLRSHRKTQFRTHRQRRHCQDQNGSLPQRRLYACWLVLAQGQQSLEDIIGNNQQLQKHIQFHQIVRSPPAHHHRQHSVQPGWSSGV